MLALSVKNAVAGALGASVVNYFSGGLSADVVLSGVVQGAFYMQNYNYWSSKLFTSDGSYVDKAVRASLLTSAGVGAAVMIFQGHPLITSVGVGVGGAAVIYWYNNKYVGYQ